MAAPEIRRGTSAQTAEVLLLLNEYSVQLGVLDRDTPETVDSFLNSPDTAMWLAYVGGVPAGCVVLRPLKHLPASGECKRLYVRTQFRRQGIAEALLDALEGYAATALLSAIYLDSRDDMQSAIALYRRRGYVSCEPYNDNPEATVFFRKVLTDRIGVATPSPRDPAR